MRTRILALALAAAATAVLAVACAGPEGEEGPAGPTGSPGPQGTLGPAGPGVIWRDANGDVQRIVSAGGQDLWFDENGHVWLLNSVFGGSTLYAPAVPYYWASNDCSGAAHVHLGGVFGREVLELPDGTYRAVPDAPAIAANFAYASFATSLSSCSLVSGVLPRAVQSSAFTFAGALPAPLATPLHPEFVP